jgi:hypothetical protein
MYTATHRFPFKALAVAGALALGLTTAARAQTNAAGERFSAVAVDLDRGTQTPLQIVVDRWSSAADQERLTNVLMTKGADKLLDALQDAPKVGYIRSTESLAWDLHFASRTKGEDGGERIILATDRPMSMSEVWNQSRTVDYPFTVIELHVNDSGDGDGTLSLATKVIPDKENHLVTLENYDTQRIRLQQVHRVNSSN